MPFDPELINKMLPVDKYIGGAEHACMHLLYARFFTKALRDLGYLKFDEPFTSLVHQGLILGPDGNKMSKSRGNVVSPDSIIQKVGADAFRLYLMFGFSYIEGGPWNETGIDSIVKFIERIERIVTSTYKARGAHKDMNKAEKDLNFVRHNTIKRVTADTEIFSFNTAIARLMELVNALNKYDTVSEKNIEFMKSVCLDLVLLIAPFTPCFAEELYEIIGGKGSVLNVSYPVFNPECLIRDEYELAVQINSKNRDKIMVGSNLSNAEIIVIAKAAANIASAIDGKTIVKEIVIPKRLVNIVIK